MLAIFVRLLCVTLLGGVGTMGSYGLALWAMTQAPLAVVAALRETSILFGAFIAFVLLKEKVASAHRGGAGYCSRCYPAAPGVIRWQH